MSLLNPVNDIINNPIPVMTIEHLLDDAEMYSREWILNEQLKRSHSKQMIENKLKLVMEK